jgi:hypothetical protein
VRIQKRPKPGNVVPGPELPIDAAKSLIKAVRSLAE